MILPIGDKLVVKLVAEKEEKVGAIFIKADASEKKIFLYEVMAVGDEVTKVKVGDKIYVYRYALQAISDGLEEVYVIKFSDVVARHG
jgi:co-chaperonin GroES (HSP10)